MMKLKLYEVLDKVEEYSWKDALFLPENGKWKLNSNCAVLNLDDLDDEVETPEFAVNNHLRYALGCVP